MNHLALSCFIVAFCNIFILIFVIFNKPLTIIKKLWCLFCLAILIWSFFEGCGSIANSPYAALLYYRIAKLTAIFIPPLFFHVALLLIEQEKTYKTELKIYYVLTISYCLFSIMFPSLFLESVHPFIGLKYFISGGQLFFIFPVMYGYIIVRALYLLYASLNTYSKEKNAQIKIMITGTIIGAIGGGSTFIPAFGINFIPYPNYGVFIYSLLNTYAILKHQLLDIHVVIRKGLVYSIVIASLSLIYLLSVIILEKITQALFQYNSVLSSTGTAFVLGLCFIPFLHKIQNLIERYFYKGTQEEIAFQNKQLMQTAAEIEKYKSLSTLSSGVAHEVKNPLQAIQTFCEFLPEKLHDKDFLLDFSRIVGIEVNRINDLVLRLINYTKPNPPELKLVNIHTLVDDTLEFLNSKLINQNIKLTKLYHADVNLRIHIDKNQIRQALLNILLNAIDSMAEDGILTINTQIINSAIKGRNQNASCFVLEIADTGCGIQKDQLTRVFEPFYSQKASGTGLGLPIARTSIENHGGTISIDSEENIGTNVRIKFNLNHTQPISV